MWKRRRFGLKSKNVYGGFITPFYLLLPLRLSFVLATSDKVRTLTADEQNGDEKPGWGPRDGVRTLHPPMHPTGEAGCIFGSGVKFSTGGPAS